jgi:hypothetical protein
MVCKGCVKAQEHPGRCHELVRPREPTGGGPPPPCSPPQEVTRVALRQRQEREQRYAHINGIKLHNQWRKIMRVSKVRGGTVHGSLSHNAAAAEWGRNRARGNAVPQASAVSPSKSAARVAAHG